MYLLQSSALSAAPELRQLISILVSCSRSGHPRKLILCCNRSHPDLLLHQKPPSSDAAQLRRLSPILVSCSCSSHPCQLLKKRPLLSAAPELRQLSLVLLRTLAATRCTATSALPISSTVSSKTLLSNLSLKSSLFGCKPEASKAQAEGGCALNKLDPAAGFHLRPQRWKAASIDFHLRPS